MKKVIISLALLSTLTACGGETDTGALTAPVQKQEGQTTAPGIGEYFDGTIPTKEFTTLDGVDVDYNLKEMSATVAYSQSTMMMYQPEDYWGKTMRIDGTYMTMDTPEFGVVHLVLLLDETNCCQGFVEFDLPEGSIYPPEGVAIGLVGTFTLVEDDGAPYSILKVNKYEF